MEWTRRNYQMGLAGFGYNWDEGDADTWTLIRRPEPVVWEEYAAKAGGAEAGQAGLAGLHSGGSAGGFARGSYGGTGGSAGLSLGGFGASGGGAELGLEGALGGQGVGGLGMASGDDVPPESLADEDSRFLYVHGIKVRQGLGGCPHRQGEGLGQMRQQGRSATFSWHSTCFSTAWVCLSMPGSRAHGHSSLRCILDTSSSSRASTTLQFSFDHVAWVCK